MGKRKGPVDAIYKKQCKYVGSVAITQHGSEERQQFLNEKIAEMTDGVKGIPVLLVFLEEGVKIMKEDGSEVKMAHSINRIRFSSSQPERKTFAYVAKTVSGTHKIVQAHLFKTKKSSHTKEMNVSLQKIFKMSYTKATVIRKEQQEGFDVENKGAKVKGKRWARHELAVGHDLSSHAQHAQYAMKKTQSMDLPAVPSQHPRDRPLPKEPIPEESTNHDRPRRDPPRRTLSLSDPPNVNGLKISSQNNTQNGQRNVLPLSPTRSVPADVKNLQFVEPAQRISYIDGRSPTKIITESHIEGYVNIVDKRNEPLPPIPVERNPHCESMIFEMTEEEILKDVDWYQLGYSREVAEKILGDRSIGSFFVRGSQSQIGTYVLTVKIPKSCKASGFGNFLIEVKDGQFCLRGFKPVFSSLTDLISHYGSCREDIPVQLYLGFQNELVQDDTKDGIDDDDDDNDDADYQYYTSADDMLKELASI